MKTKLFLTKIAKAVALACVIMVNNANAFEVHPGVAISTKQIEAKDVIVAGNYIFSAGTFLNNAGNFDIYITKYAFNGVSAHAPIVIDYNGGDDVPVKIKSDASGNIYILATVYNSTSGNNDMVLYKYTNGLSYVFSRSYTAGNETAVDLLIKNSNVYMLGNTKTSVKGSDVVIIKYNTAGTLSAPTQIFSFGTTTYDEVAREIKSDASGNIYICGYRDTAVTGSDGMLLKYNSSLTLQWSKAFSPTGAFSSENFNSLVITGSGIYAGGNTWNLSSKNNFLITKFNSTTGNPISYTTTGSLSYNDEIVKLDTMGSFVYATGTREYNSGGKLLKKILTRKFDPFFGVVWSREYSSTVNDNFVCSDMEVNSNNGSVAVCGTATHTSFSGISYNARLLLVYDDAGSIIQEDRQSNNVGCNSSESTANALFFMGPCDNVIYNCGKFTSWLSTFDFLTYNRIEDGGICIFRSSSNEISESIEEKVALPPVNELLPFDFTIAPNPVSSELNIRVNKAGCVISVFDMLGNIVLTALSKEMAFNLDVTKLRQGSYLITIINDEEKISKRFVKM